MPIFEFACRTCGRDFEELVPSSDEHAVACPKCGGGDVEKRWSAFAAHGASPERFVAPGGCGRCGDPNGPCGLE